MAGGRGKGNSRTGKEKAKEIVFRGSNSAGRRKYKRLQAKKKKAGAKK